MFEYKKIDLDSNCYDDSVKLMIKTMKSQGDFLFDKMNYFEYKKIGKFFDWVNFKYILNNIPNCEETESSISVCILTYNSESFISNCIESIKSFASEIIFIDSGSTDNTLSIIEKHADKIIEVENSLGFDKKRNIAIENASSEWIFMIDSDESLTQNAASKLKKYIKWGETNDVSVFWLSRYWIKPFQSDPIEFYNGTLCLWPDPQARLFKNNGLITYHGELHEKIYSSSNFIACLLTNPICHLMHFKYWLYNDDELQNLIKTRENSGSDNNDAVQLMPWLLNNATEVLDKELVPHYTRKWMKDMRK